jgi:single-stranded DNA-binding protein
MRVLVEGRVDCEAYADKHGKPVAALKLVATDVRFLSSVADTNGVPDGSEHIEASEPIERIR